MMIQGKYTKTVNFMLVREWVLVPGHTHISLIMEYSIPFNRIILLYCMLGID